MPVCLSIRLYTLLLIHPSIHSTIYILARGPFALCQAILIPIYHLFLHRSFFSISPFFLDASFFFKPFDSNWFLSGPLIRMPFSSFFFIHLLLLFPQVFAALFLSPSSFHSILHTYEYEFVLPCRLVQSNALSYFWLPRGKGICERKAHDDVRKESYRNIGLDQTFARFVAHEKRTFAIRQREKSIVRIAYYCDSLILYNYTLVMHEETIYIPSN